MKALEELKISAELRKLILVTLKTKNANIQSRYRKTQNFQINAGAINAISPIQR